MHGVSTLTSKGQLTLPIEIRRWLGLKQGDQVEFAEEDGRIFLKPKRRQVDFSKFIGAVPEMKAIGSSEAWMRELRDEEDGAE